MADLSLAQTLLLVVGGAITLPWCIAGLIAAYRHLTRKPPLL